MLTRLEPRYVGWITADSLGILLLSAFFLLKASMPRLTLFKGSLASVC